MSRNDKSFGAFLNSLGWAPMYYKNISGYGVF